MIPPTQTQKNRFDWLDFLRGIAVLWMIEVHLLDVALWPTLKHGWWYGKIDFYNGTVAPIFLFCAGASFWIAYQNGKIKEQPKSYLKRLGFILLIAYWLNVPHLSFKHCLDTPEFSKTLFFSSDILHTIVFASFIAFLFASFQLSEFFFLLLCTALALAIYGCSSFIWEKEFYKLLLPPFSSYLAPYPISKFPLFPWMGHFFAGLSLLGFYQKAKNKTRFFLILLFISLISPTLIFYVKEYYIPNPSSSQENLWWRASFGHSLLRLSRVSLLLSLLLFLQKFFSLQGKISTWIKNIGRESLFYYVTHIALIYGSVVNKGLRAFGLGAWNWWGVLILYVMIILFLYHTGQAWHEYKKNFPERLQRILAYAFLLFTLIFFTLP